MGLLFTIIIGALIGWIASKLVGTDEQQGALANVVVGIFGSILGKWLFADVLGFDGAANAGEWSLLGLFWGVVGAVILIIVLKAFNVFKK
jgi:uncharacterized membrane protein YeaQ/YmgE (transglycosylase-associated protein family)